MFIIGTISAKLRIFPFIHFVCRVLYISELNWTLLLSVWLLSVLCFLNSWKKNILIHPFKGTLSSILVWLTSVNGTGNYTANAKKTLLKCSIRKFKWREEGYYFCRNFKNILSTKSRSSEYYSVCYFHAISQPLSLFKDNLIICHMYIFSLFTIKAVDITTSGNGSCLYSWG